MGTPGVGWQMGMGTHRVGLAGVGGRGGWALKQTPT